MVKAAKGNDLGLGIGEKDFATSARREIANIVCAQIVQKRGRVRTHDLDLGSRGGVEESGCLMNLLILGLDVHPAPHLLVNHSDRFMSILKEEYVPGFQKALRLGSR